MQFLNASNAYQNLLAAKVATGGAGTTGSSRDVVGACALGVSGTVYCWGSNKFAQLGVEGISYSSAPL